MRQENRTVTRRSAWDWPKGVVIVRVAARRVCRVCVDV